MKPLDRYVLACVADQSAVFDSEGAICSDVVSLLRWNYGRTHEHSTVAKRLSDLHDSGLIRRVGQRTSELTHRPQSVWTTTAKGRRLLARLDRQPKEASA